MTWSQPLTSSSQPGTRSPDPLSGRPLSNPSSPTRALSPNSGANPARLHGPKEPQTKVQLIRGHYTSRPMARVRAAPALVSGAGFRRWLRSRTPFGGGDGVRFSGVVHQRGNNERHLYGSSVFRDPLLTLRLQDAGLVLSPDGR